MKVYNMVISYATNLKAYITVVLIITVFISRCKKCDHRIIIYLHFQNISSCVNNKIKMLKSR